MAGRRLLTAKERIEHTEKNSFAIFAVSRGEKGLGNRLIISFQFP